MSLPTRTTGEDVHSVVAYLKTKPTGATRDEIKATLDEPAVDPRKISAYEMWNLVEQDGDRLKLTTRGRRLARAHEGDKIEVFADILRSVPAYRMILEWAFHQHVDVIENVDVAARWHDHNREEVGTDSEETILRQVVCFFHIADQAGIGQYIQGRRGSSTRLELGREALGQFVGETSLSMSSSADELEDDIDRHDGAPFASEKANENEPPGDVAVAHSNGRSSVSMPEDIGEEQRVFISHGHNMEIVEQIKTMLELGDLDHEVAVESEDTAIPVPEKVFDAMRRCTSAVICVTADERKRQDDGTYVVNENVLIEIGAAFVLYDRRVVLVWDKRLPVPSNLQGLYRCEFEGDELSWTAGMKLMKAVNRFKRSAIGG